MASSEQPVRSAKSPWPIPIVLALTLGIAVPAAQDERTIYVNVMDADARPVKELTAADFLVRENGVACDITGLRVATEPLLVSVLVDTTPETREASRDLRSGLAAFAADLLGASPESQISISEFGGTAVTSVRFTSKLGEIEKALPKVAPRADGGSALFQALVDAGKDLGPRPGARKAIVSINVEPSDETGAIRPKAVADEIQRSRAALWAISLVAGASRNQNRDLLLLGIANNSGGLRLTIPSPSGLEAALRNVAQHLLSTYAITFKPGDAATPVKQTHVLVNRQGARTMTLIWPAK